MTPPEKTEDLRECPFCPDGGMPHRTNSIHGVTCLICDAAAKNATAWNTRADSPTTPQDAGKVEEAALSEAKDQLWQMAHIQDKQEDESAFMVNWLRGTIKIPQSVRDRIYWSEHAARKVQPNEAGKALEALHRIEQSLLKRISPSVHEEVKSEAAVIRAALSTPQVADIDRIRDVLNSCFNDLERVEQAIAILTGKDSK